MPTFLKEDKSELFQIRFPILFAEFSAQFNHFSLDNVEHYLQSYQITILAFQDGSFWGFETSGHQFAGKKEAFATSEEKARWEAVWLVLTLIEVGCN